MSRIGSRAIPLNDVKYTYVDGVLSCSGSLGKSERVIPREYVELFEENGALHVKAIEERLTSKQYGKRTRELWGLTRALVNNDIQGVSVGFKEEIVIRGIGYSLNIEGERLKIEIGFSHPVFLEIPDGISVEVKKARCTLLSSDKEKLGSFAAKILAVRRYDVYKNKGIKRERDQIKLKEGKSGKK
jgi:large subunit ribosomal protein L6